MPEGVTKQTTQMFVMQMADGAGIFRQVTVQGTKLSFDPATGLVSGGLISSLRYDIITDDGKTRHVSDSHTWGGLNLDARALAEAFGTTYWSHVKVVTERFATLDTFKDVARSFYTDDKAVMDGTDLGERLQGSVRSEVLDGHGGNDLLRGQAGDDTIIGGDGDDRMLGGIGNDVLTDTSGKRNVFSGGAGDDQMTGGASNDQMSGDVGRDMLFGNGGDDSASGGAGADSFVFDIKVQGTLRINDFAYADDVLTNLQVGNAKESYVNFLDHAAQVGRNVEYHDGDMTVILMHTRLDKLVIENFAGAESMTPVLM
jgi:Ca2+-binding RTX toxin-like protein